VVRVFRVACVSDTAQDSLKVIECKPLVGGGQRGAERRRRGRPRRRRAPRATGRRRRRRSGPRRAVYADPMKPKLTPPATKRLKLV